MFAFRDRNGSVAAMSGVSVIVVSVDKSSLHYQEKACLFELVCGTELIGRSEMTLTASTI